MADQSYTEVLVELQRVGTIVSAMQEDITELRGQVDRLDSHVRGNGAPGLIARVGAIEKNCIRSKDWQSAHDAEKHRVTCERARGYYAIIIACISGIVAITSAILGGMK